ncbi:MAG: ABC transporter ATP-binding protein [Desulfobacterota bacterium]|nr:ABC transporter ATP-binding protein [Thermodesulfobacteriota bacterium]
MNDNPIILQACDIILQRDNRTTLSIPHLAVHQGEVVSLIGPNGAGKTSLLLVLAGLLRPMRGTLRFNENNITCSSALLAYRRSIAMVFQEPLLLHTTVFNNVAAGLKMRGIPHAEIRRIVPYILERFHIEHLAQRSSKALSGGEAQRVSLARAFAVNPRIVFLDEPFSSLDPPTREALLQDFESVLSEMKTTVVFATHHQDEALRLADRMAVMRDGTVVQIGTCEEVINAPQDEFVATFVGMETLLRGMVTETKNGMVTIAVGNQRVTAIADARVGEELLIGIRPEHVTLGTVSAPHTTSARNMFAATVVDVVLKGLFYKVVLDCGFPLTAFVTGQSREALGIRTGTRLTATFKATAVHILRKKG